MKKLWTYQKQWSHNYPSAQPASDFPNNENAYNQKRYTIDKSSVCSKCERSRDPHPLVVNGSETGITSAVACCKNGGGRELTVDNGGRRRGDRRCGLCSLVARAFRRAVCGAPSRRGSGDSYQELTAPPPTTEEETAQVSLLLLFSFTFMLMP